MKLISKEEEDANRVEAALREQAYKEAKFGRQFAVVAVSWLHVNALACYAIAWGVPWGAPWLPMLICIAVCVGWVLVLYRVDEDLFTVDESSAAAPWFAAGMVVAAIGITAALVRGAIASLQGAL